ncbi:hypothetical protein [Faecalibacterium sp. An121]|uniref:hypothetical protein n=1 Tax=Faecalibacterium sp. An121 TaxID=1965550 RepID=UPI000B377292|nr:hypothetical protein [Faecalibacterium sp. An121]OUQ35216.1 hypothetical protein B5E66_11745 [Faecalibacterium sp. An121]
MKLKKIASLALAGIMAVSMLAGCKDGGNGNSGSSSENTNSASGYSAMLGEAVSDKVKDMDNVVFADNEKDQTALEDAVKNVGAADILSASKNTNLHDVGNKAVLADFKDAADLHREALLNSAKSFIFDGVTEVNKTRKVGDIFAIDGTMDMSKVMNQIADDYDKYFEKLQENATVISSGSPSTSTVYNFDYTISVSVVNVPATSDTTYVGSVNFIAVTVTRTVA